MDVMQFYAVPSLPFFIGQEFAIHGDDHAVPIWVLLLLDVQLEVDGAHDSFAKHLVNNRLDRRSIILRDLMEPIDERVNRNRLADRALGWNLLEGRRHFGTQAKG